MMKKLTIVCLIVCLALVLTITSCGKDMPYEDEVKLMKAFFEQKDGSGDILLSVLDRYDVSEKTAYYYLRWKMVESSGEEEMLAVFDTELQSVSFFGLDEISGKDSEIGSKWNEIKNARADRVFSQGEIEEIIKESSR